MNISIFGVIWLIALFVSFTKQIKYTLYLLIFSFVFQSAWVIEIVGVDLNASLITSIFFISRALLLKNGKIKIPSWGKYGLIYAFFTIIVSIIAPNIFSGMQLQTMTNEGFNFNRVDTVIISFSFSNLTLGLSILLYLVDAIMISNIDFHIEWRHFEKIFKNIFIFVSIVGVVHVLFTFLGVPVTILKELFHNEYKIIGNTYFDMLLLPQYRFARLMSTFYEPSYCGAYLVMALAYFYFADIKNRKIYLLTGTIELLLCLASTGFLTLIMFAFVYIFFSALRGKIPLKKIIAVGCPVIIVGIIILINPTMRNLLYNFTLGKVNSDSYSLRKIVNKYAMDAFIKTYGMGVGGNAIDTYSLFYSLLSQIGICGFILYVLFIKAVFSANLKIQDAKKKWQMISIVLIPLIASIISCQALNFCVFWMGICIFAIYNSIAKVNFVKEICGS